MSGPKQPGVSVRLRIDREGGEQVVDYATRPYAGATFTEGRVRQGGIGPIRRELSDDQGQPRMATASVLLADDDGVIRTAYAEDPTRFTATTDAHLGVLSEEGRAAALATRSLFRARVQNAPLEIGRSGLQRARSVRLELVDALAPYYDHTICRALFLRTDFPDIHRDLEHTPIPLVGGEHSDAGAEDVAGNSAEKGLVPAIYVGGRRTVDDNPTTGVPSFLAPIDDLDHQVNGTSGTTIRSYAVTKLSAVGETTISNVVVVLDAAAVLNGTDNVALSWTDDEDATGYVVYRGRGGTPNRRLRVLGPGVDAYTDDGTDSEYAPGPPAVNTAQIEGEEGAFFWDFYVVALGVVNIERLFGSDVAQGNPPRRIDLTATAGVDFLIPGHPGWPHAQPYLTLASGLRVTGFYGRGPRSQHHKDGIVTIAVQTCGYDDVGDGSGDSIQQAFPLFQHFLNQFVLLDGGMGYRSGNWGPLEEFADGSPMLQTSRFEACQELTKLWLDNAVGYTAAIYLREPITVREFVQTFCQTFDCFIATNHHGQLYPVLWDPDLEPDAGRHYRERIEILRLEPPVLDREFVEPRIFFQFDWDPDARRYRSEVLQLEDEPAYLAQRHRLRDPGVRGLRYTRDQATAYDAMQRRLARLARPRWRQALVAKFQPGLEEEPGNPFRVTHADGADADGWVHRPFFAVGQIVDAARGEVLLVGYDRGEPAAS